MLLLLLSCQPGKISLGDDTSPVSDTSSDDSGDVEHIGGDTSEDTDTDDGDDDDDEEEAPPDVVVDCNGAGDYTTIAAAIAAEHSGTRIGLMPCTYDESVDLLGKSLDIFGVEGRDVTIIHGGTGGPVFTAQRGESLGTRLAHVTIQGGGGTYGAGVYLDSAAVVLQDVLITGTSRTSAVVYTEGAGLTMLDVEVRDNGISRDGYLFYVDNGWLVTQDSEFACDDATYGIVEHEATLLLDTRVDCSQSSVAVYVGGGELHARRSDIVGGQYGIYGEDDDDTRNERMWLFNTSVTGDDTAVYASYMHVKLRNDTFWGGGTGLTLSRGHIESYAYSTAFHGSRCAVAGDGYAYAAGWNALDGDACNFDSADSVASDPLFVDAPADLHLQDGSPLIDAGDPDEGENDDDGTRNDIGRYGGEEADGPR